MKEYNPTSIEAAWQQRWEDTGLYNARDNDERPKWYQLEFFPYPSGTSMHVGHVRNYVISDTFARYQRMHGFNVLHPMGWDAFGLPAENYAIETGTPPRSSIDTNIVTFKRQLQTMGLSYDWSREIDSSSEEYYRWTQALFLHFYEQGLAYQKESAVNWCPVDQTVLANEQVVKRDNVSVCERCGSEVEKRDMRQWFLRITEYADRLLQDLDSLDWPEHIKTMQRHWIGRSEGATISFPVVDTDLHIDVFTTRADTLFGATYMVIAPEHEFVDMITTERQRSAMDEYVAHAVARSEVERQANKEKTGCFTGRYAINPATGDQIPVWVADYVLHGYGTGAIMAVPAHDERDRAFADTFGLPIRKVIDGETLTNSGPYNHIAIAKANESIMGRYGKREVNYKMRDWGISRQRYWGAPIPIIHCPDCGPVAVPSSDLPVVLPELDDYRPSSDGRSPLAKVKDWVQTPCPQCGQMGRRETDTMDGFVDSSWYFLRYTDPHNTTEPFSTQLANQWGPVDSYVGGAEHAVAHLLFARFFTKVLFDAGMIDFHEPFTQLRNQGMIGGADGRKMGKRYGNAVTPDEIIVAGYGADSLRLYELFIGPYDQGVDWNPRGIDGTKRFLNRFWNIAQRHIAADVHDGDSDEVIRVTHKTIKKVTEDIERFGFNTAVAAMMEAMNDFYRLEVDHPVGSPAWTTAITSMTKLIAPFAPHIAEEIWADMDNEGSVHVAPWPTYDESMLVDTTTTFVVAINGKRKGEINLPIDTDEETAVAAAHATIAAQIADGEIIKIVFIPSKMINTVMR